MGRNMMDWVDGMIRAEQKKGMPVLSFPAIQKMGITVRELIGSGDYQAEAMRIVAEETPKAAASVSFMDLSVEAEAFGSAIHVSDDEVPTVVGSIISEEDEADALEVPEVGAGRTGLYLEAMEKAAKLITDRPVFAGSIGPFSLTGRLMDVSEAMICCYEEPDMVHTVLQKVTGFLTRYINAYRETGANGVVVAEPLAGVLSPDLAEEFSAAYMKQIVEQVQTDDFIVVYHNCGNSVIQQIGSICDTGCRVLHFGNAIRMEEIVPLIPGNIAVFGNVDPAGQFRNGTPDSVKSATIALMEKCARYKNFIPSSGCDIPPLSSWDNIHAFFEGIDAFYERRDQDGCFG